MLLPSWLTLFRDAFSGTPPKRGRRPRGATVRLVVEALEDRQCPSGGYLFVPSYDTNSVLRYDGNTGAYVDTPVPKGAGGLSQPYAVLIGPHDHQLYVSSGQFGG